MTNSLCPAQKSALRQLHAVGHGLTRQTYKTLKGQILSGSHEAALRGLEKILNKKAEGDASVV